MCHNAAQVHITVDMPTKVQQSKVNVNLYSILSWSIWSAPIWSMCNNGITQFYLPPIHEPYLPLLPSCKASPPFCWYSLRLPTKGWPGWVDLGGWLHTEINVPNWELNPDTVTHPGTNWARRRLTSLIETYMLPLHQTTTQNQSKLRTK